MAVFKNRLRKPGMLRKAFAAALACSAAAFVGHGDVARGQDHSASQWQIANTNVSVDSRQERQAMRMVINTSREITADQAFKRVRIQNPDILSALPLEGGNRLQISAVSTGVTQVDLLGADGSVHSIEVMVLGDVRELEAILRQLFPDANLQVIPVQQGCIVSGFVSSDEHVDEVMTIAELYFPTVINKVDVTGVYTIQLEAQIMEVSRTKLRQLGIDWAFGNGDDAVSQTVSGLLTATGTTFAGTGSETFKIGVIENGSSFFTAIQALRQNNLVKVLASPTLTAVDGRPASFNAGGEIPIIVPAGLGQVAVQFREFGTRLDYVAKVRGNGKIALEVRPYVSEIDPSRSVSINGISVPGLRSRFLETGVELGAGQTLALAGLLQVKSETINIGLPWLSDMPYLGAAFRTTREEQNEIELLITVTPNFAGPMDPHEVPPTAPGMNSNSPTDKELFWRGYVETPVGGEGYCPPGMGTPGLIEMQDYSGAQMGQPSMGPASGSVYPAGGGEFNAPIPQPIPNPAAMSVGPNAPKLATRPGLLPPPNFTQPPQNANPGLQNPPNYSSGPIVR